jgi:HJR/Mrr/RecB family endonuclease
MQDPATKPKIFDEINLYSEVCTYCGTACRLYEDDSMSMEAQHSERAAVCTVCGWWSWSPLRSELDELEHGSARAVLERFSVESNEVPVSELARYLEQHQDQLMSVAPDKFEELVAAVYRDALGYTVEYRSYGRGDKGIDIICIQTDSPNKIALQVKRYNQPIKLGLIHQFCGAMVESRFGRGVFVTAGRFQRGCYSTASALEEIGGYEIDLVDGRRFLEFIGCMNVQRKNKVFVPVWGTEVDFLGSSTDADRWLDVSGGD